MSEIMTPLADSDQPTVPLPGEDLAGYLTGYVREITFTEQDPSTVLDRYHEPDFDWYNDGLRLDRANLLAHVKAGRRNAVSAQVEVHDTVRAGDRVAARYTLTATLRKGRQAVTEIYMFGQLAPDGRLRRIDQLTRILPTAPGAAPTPVPEST